MSRLKRLWERINEPEWRGFVRGFVYGNVVGFSAAVGIIGLALLAGRFFR